MLEILKHATDKKQIDARVNEWGRWTRYHSDCGMTLSPLAALLKANTGTVLSAAPLISDDEAELISKAVIALTRARPELGEAINVFYCTSINNVLDLGKKIGVSRTRAAEMLKEGLAFLQGYFCNLSTGDKVF